MSEPISPKYVKYSSSKNLSFTKSENSTTDSVIIGCIFGAVVFKSPVWGVYSALSLATTAIAFYVQDYNFAFRWILGMLLYVVCFAYVVLFILPKYPDPDIIGPVFAMCAFWMSSNSALILGGKKLLVRFGVNNITRACVYGLCPAQVKFVEQIRSNVMMRRSYHLFTFVSIFLGVTYLASEGHLKSLTDIWYVRVEMLAFMACMAMYEK